MEEVIEIDLYHATSTNSAISMTKSQKFICNDDKANNEFLGRGAYFYKTRQEAIEWVFKMYNDEHGDYPNNYKDIFDDYRIVHAKAKCYINEIFDLDERANIRKVDYFAEILTNKMGKKIDSKKNNVLAVLLNYSEKEKWTQEIKIVEKTFPFSIKIIKNLLRVNKKVICVKDTSIIERMQIDKKITLKEYENCKYYICGG